MLGGVGGTGASVRMTFVDGSLDSVSLRAKMAVSRRMQGVDAIQTSSPADFGWNGQTTQMALTGREDVEEVREANETPSSQVERARGSGKQ